MKKIIFLSLLLGIFFQTNANRDAVNNFKYGAYIYGPYEVKVKTINKACEEPIVKTYKGNIIDELNFTPESGTTCAKKDGILKCFYTKTKAELNGGLPTGGTSWAGGTNIPGSSGKSYFKLYATNKQILETLNLPYEIYSKVEGDYVQNNFSFKTNLITYDSVVDIEDRSFKSSFADMGLLNLFGGDNTIEYYEKDECDNDNKIVEKCKDDKECNEIIVDPRPVEECSVDTICIPGTGDTVPPEFEDVKLDGCNLNQTDGVYYCKSNQNIINLKLKFSTFGTYTSIQRLEVNVNNWENTGPAFTNAQFARDVNITDTNSEYDFQINGTNGTDFKVQGGYVLEITGFGDKNDKASRTSNVYYLRYKIVPNNDFIINNPLSGETNGKKANNNDFYQYCADASDSNGNKLLGLERDVKIDILDGIHSNRVSNNGTESLEVFDKSFNKDNSQICFKIRSSSPAKKDLKFKISLQKHNDYNTETISEYKEIGNKIINSVEFKKLFNGEIKASDNGGISWDDLPVIGTLIKYKVITNTYNGIIPQLTGYNKDYIKGVTNIQTQGITGQSYNDFSLRLNTTSDAKAKPGIIINNGNKSPIIVNYSLGGEDISYILSKNLDANDATPLDLYGQENSFLGVKVIGNLQGSGKQDLTGQASNFTDLSKSELRAKIRKNAYTFISSMTSGQVVNGVKYVDGDYTISSNPSGYETLVVKNGNLTISSDITNTKFGIIVLKDSYDVNNGYEAGNIIIKPTVKKLNGLFYADGGFVSGNANGDIYTTDSTTRTNALKNQLTLNGSLFTRNTIGGAILGTSGKYILPGGSETTDFNRAMVYDLNYIRRGTNGWDLNGNGSLNSGEYNNYGFIVKYNPNLIISSPKLFNLK